MPPINRSSLFGDSLLILWSSLCISLFLLISAPVSHIHQFIFEGVGPFLRGLERVHLVQFFGMLIVSFTGALLYSAACTSGGTFLLALFRARPSTTFTSRFHLIAHFGTAFILGQIAISSVFILLGGLYRITPYIDLFALAIMVAVGIRPLINLYQDVRGTAMVWGGCASIGGFFHILKWLLIAVLFLTLLYSSARLSYDASAMYFSDEKLTAMTGRISFFPNDSFIVSSFHTGIQYAMIIQVFGDQAARLLSWFGGLVFIIFSLALAELLGLSRRAVYLLFALILTSTAFLDLMGDGKIDLLSSGSALAAVYWAAVDEKSNFTQSSAPVLIGLLSGFAIISRPFYLPLLLVFLAIFYGWELVTRVRKGQLEYRIVFRHFSGLVLGAVPLLVLHLLANQIILGDFLAPFENARKIGGASMWQWSFDPQDVWFVRAFYPLVVTFVNSPQSLGNISPLILAFVPSVLNRDVRKRISLPPRAIRLCIVALSTIVLWIWSYHMIEEIRYVLFLWPIVFMPVANIIDAILTSGDRILRGATVASIAGLLIFLAIRSAYISVVTYSPVDRNGSPQCYDSPLCNFIRPVNHIAAPGARVLALNAYRYYLRPDLFACSSKADEYIRLRDAWEKGDEFFWMEVHRQGYEYLTYEENYAVRHLSINYVPDPSDVPHWMRLESIYGSFGDDQVAYRIDVTTPPMSFQKSCSQDSLGIWDVK